MNNDETQVLVIGAGPTGLTAACELARHGVRVRVLDAGDEPPRGSRGKGVQPRTLELLDRIGITGRLLPRGRSTMAIRRYDGAGGHQDHDLRSGIEPTPESPYARGLMAPQWGVEQVLGERLSESGVDVEYSRRLVGLAETRGGVTANLADGSSIAAGYVIGCDGGSSTVRQCVGAEFLGHTDERARMILGDVTLDGLGRDHWHMWSGTTYPFLALCPLPATESFQLQLAWPEGTAAEPKLDVLQGVVDQVAGPGIRLRDASWLSTWRLNVRMVEHFRFGRVFLAGDAAHVHSPAGAQGMNTGIQDSINLAWKLAHVIEGADESLLDSYEAERLPVAAEVLGLSSKLMGRKMESRGADGELTRQLGITYRGGPLAPDDPGDGPRAGDRAPDAPCHYPDGSPVRLFELQRDPGWTLLGFGVQPEPPSGPVRTVALGTDVLDTGGHAQAAFGAVDGDLVLIRPDGYVGIRGNDMATITTYLDAHTA